MKKLVKHVLLFSHNFVLQEKLFDGCGIFADNKKSVENEFEIISRYFCRKITLLASNAQNILLEHRLTSK